MCVVDRETSLHNHVCVCDSKSIYTANTSSDLLNIGKPASIPPLLPLIPADNISLHKVNLRKPTLPSLVPTEKPCFVKSLGTEATLYQLHYVHTRRNEIWLGYPHWKIYLNSK